MDNPFTTLIDVLGRSRQRQYWTLQAIGWSGYVFFLIAQSLASGEATAVHTIYSLCAMLTGLLLTMGMHRVFKDTWDHPPVARAAYTVLAVGAATALWSAWKFYVFLQIYPHAVEGKDTGLLAGYLFWYSYSFFILLSWAGLYYGIKYYQMTQAEHEKGLRIAAMAHQSQLKMLRYQLNPHFLFNTLNAISTLIMDRRGDIANRMVTELSRFLRYSLDNDPMQKVSLAQEVEAMRLYLDIEKVRFEERLELDIRMDEAARRARIPSLLLQPLVENSIKYAVARSERGGTVHLHAKVFADELLLELSDDGPGIPALEQILASAQGVGLTNTRERLRVIYGENHSCKFSNLEPHGLRVSIRLPYEP
ncbi:MAG: histidine kinase [Gammaproteobacteria bacterium]|nr:histidine kinase [Gammaproteobacteria bacterium]